MSTRFKNTPCEEFHPMPLKPQTCSECGFYRAFHPGFRGLPSPMAAELVVAPMRDAPFKRWPACQRHDAKHTYTAAEILSRTDWEYLVAFSAAATTQVVGIINRAGVEQIIQLNADLGAHAIRLPFWRPTTKVHLMKWLAEDRATAVASGVVSPTPAILPATPLPHKACDQWEPSDIATRCKHCGFHVSQHNYTGPAATTEQKEQPTS